MKKWSKSKILLRTQSWKFSIFDKILTQPQTSKTPWKSTIEHFRIPFWDLEFTHKWEMRMLKKWSKSEISIRTAVMKLFEFWQNLILPQTSGNPSNQQKNTLEYHFDTWNSLTSEKWECWKSDQNLEFC